MAKFGRISGLAAGTAMALAAAVAFGGQVATPPEAAGYLGQVARRVVPKSPRAGILRDAAVRASFVPGAGIELSTGLLDRLQTEGELAGVLAHEVSHRGTRCVLSKRRDGSAADESEATREAVERLSAAGYDPLELLAFLTKLRFDDPAVQEAFSIDDLLALRAQLETAAAPTAGLVVTTSAFELFRRKLPALSPRDRDRATLTRRKGP